MTSPILGRAPGWQKTLARWRTQGWFRDKEFSSDWASAHYPIWMRVLRPSRARETKILEIGTWEGRAAVFFLNYLPQSHVVCIDTFAGGSEHDPYDLWSKEESEIERRFEYNLRPFGTRVEKVKNRSAPALAQLTAQGRRFDLAYIDGSHRRDDVLADTLATWPLMNVGGVVIWDDYEWGPKLPPEDRPRPAIDEFLMRFEGAYELLAKGMQVIVRRVR